MRRLFKKELPPDFSKPAVRQAFAQEARTKQELFQKELDVNSEQQLLLKERIRLMNVFINDLPASDPQYGILASQVKMDQIELDELIKRGEVILSLLKNA